MNTDQIMQLTYLGLLGAAIAGSFLVSNRQNLGKTAQQAAIWALIFIGMIGAIGLWNDISGDVTARQSFVGTDRVEVPRSSDGHYYLTLDINGQPINFVIDTGATHIVLTQDDARTIGIDTGNLAYIGSAYTANGTVDTAAVWLNDISLGDIRDQDVPAVVNDSQMEGSLLGMTYLNLYERIEIANGRLVLIR